MSAPTTRLVWSRPRQRTEVRGIVRGTIQRSSAGLHDGGPVLHLDRWPFTDGVEWYALIDAWHVDIRIPGLDGSTTWPQARAAALLHLFARADALLAARLGLIARARR